MAKRSFRGKPKKAKPPAQGGMMAQLQQMQEQMAASQKNLENEFVTVSSGGGAITITISGHQRVKSIEIKPEVLDPEDVEFFQDMMLVAMNEAIEKSQEMAAGQMEGITGGLGMDDLLGGLGL